MKKRCKRKVIQARTPCLVALALVPELGIAERMSIEAIRGGYATTDHYDTLADCRNMLTLGMTIRRDQSIKPACDLGLIALQNIRDREKLTGKIGATGNELNALLLMVGTSEDWWPRQGGTVFAQAYRIMKSRDLTKGDQEVTV